MEDATKVVVVGMENRELICNIRRWMELDETW